MPPPQLLHHQLLTVSVHVGVFTLLYGGLVLQTDLHLAAVRPVVHDDLTATRATLNTRPLGISLSQHYLDILLLLMFNLEKPQLQSCD